MPPKKPVAAPPPEPEPEPEPEGDPPTGTDYFRYADSAVTYEGAYASWVPPPDPSLIPAEPPPPPPKGKKGNAVEPEPEEPKEPPKLVKQGVGTYTDSDIYYKGNWDVDVVNGHGLVKYQSGASYEGEWDQGKYHGEGKYVWADGSWYEGGWHQDKFHGMGKYYDKSRDRTFEGQYYNGAGPGFYGQE